MCPRGTTTASTCPSSHWSLCEWMEPFPRQHTFWHTASHASVVRPAFASVPRCCVKAKLSAGNQSEFRENTRLRGFEFYISVCEPEFFRVPQGCFCGVVLLCWWPFAAWTWAHTEDYHMGSRVLGGETRRVLTLLFLLHQKKQRKEREGEEGWRGMCVCLAEWGKCHVLMRSCLHGRVISLSWPLFLCVFVLQLGWTWVRCHGWRRPGAKSKQPSLIF